MRDKYAVVAARREAYAAPMMCAALGVSPSGFCAAQNRSPSAHATADESLPDHVRAAHAKRERRYGALRAHGVRDAVKRVARLIREDGLVARRRRRWVRPTNGRHAHPIAPNTLARRFDIAQAGTANLMWVGDIKYVSMRKGWRFRAVVPDLGSRRVVGWAMHTSPEERIVLVSLDWRCNTDVPPRGSCTTRIAEVSLRDGHAKRFSRHTAWPVV